MPDDWSPQQVAAAVTEYFHMLEKELVGKPYNKAEHNRNLQKISGRDRGSIEFKHRNISAVLIELGYPYIDGYKPLFNYQKRLLPEVEARAKEAVTLNKVARKAVEKPVDSIPVVRNILSIQVPPPVREKKTSSLVKAERILRKPVQRNYLETEAHNASLGLAGEKFILEFEYERLWKAGKRKFADRIEHVAQSKGDYVGYDILSFEKTGRERFIEVKTTRYGAFTPFFASRNEVKVSEIYEKEYQLYRLFHFNKERGRQPELYILPGALRHTCTLEPNQFVVMPK
jgi:hypothetical protein